jgi:hypothetical protein
LQGLIRCFRDCVLWKVRKPGSHPAKLSISVAHRTASIIELPIAGVRLPRALQQRSRFDVPSPQRNTRGQVVKRDRRRTVTAARRVALDRRAKVSLGFSETPRECGFVTHAAPALAVEELNERALGPIRHHVRELRADASARFATQCHGVDLASFAPKGSH